MATLEERDQLLAVACTWCGAAPREECTVKGLRELRVPSTLDGGCHDARWRAAMGREARVVPAAVDVRRPVEDTEPVLVGAVERPW